LACWAWSQSDGVVLLDAASGELIDGLIDALGELSAHVSAREAALEVF
jgi:hypothetical protein